MTRPTRLCRRVADMFQSVQLNVNNPHFLIMQGRVTKVGASTRRQPQCGCSRVGRRAAAVRKRTCIAPSAHDGQLASRSGRQPASQPGWERAQAHLQARRAAQRTPSAHPAALHRAKASTLAPHRS